MWVLMEGLVQPNGFIMPALWNQLGSFKEIFKPKTHHQRF